MSKWDIIEKVLPILGKIIIYICAGAFLLVLFYGLAEATTQLSDYFNDGEYEYTTINNPMGAAADECWSTEGALFCKKGDRIIEVTSYEKK